MMNNSTRFLVVVALVASALLDTKGAAGTTRNPEDDIRASIQDCETDDPLWPPPDPFFAELARGVRAYVHDHDQNDAFNPPRDAQEGRLVWFRLHREAQSFGTVVAALPARYRNGQMALARPGEDLQSYLDGLGHRSLDADEFLVAKAIAARQFADARDGFHPYCDDAESL